MRTHLFTIFLILHGGIAMAGDLGSLEERYASLAGRIIDAALGNQKAWQKLEFLCDRIGHRLSGSSQLTDAVEWAAETMRMDGLSNVRMQTVSVRRWVRGSEWGRIVTPVSRPLSLLGLGGSVATPAAGIKAEIVVARSFEELEAMGRERVSGRIAVFNAPYQDYGRTAVYRHRGASRAAALGAVAALIRSVTPRSLDSPHTGGMSYLSEYPRIPAAAISVENAELLQRLFDSGDTTEVELYMEAQMLPPVESANVIGEIPGSERPQEVVVIGGHIDSWDVGQGAHDDGGGVAVSMEAARLLLELGLRPRRTIRVVLFTNEENGLAGGRAYRDLVEDQLESHVAAIEMDSGAEKPVGFGLGLFSSNDQQAQYDRAMRRLTSIGKLLKPIGADEVTRGGGGADISPLIRGGVPGLGLRTIGTHYFDWHHTEADTLDKVNPEDLKANLAAMAVVAFVLADMPERLVD